VKRTIGVRVALLAALAAAWSAAAYFLWQTTVPASLHLPHVDELRFFTAAQLHAAASFSTVSDLLFWGSALAQIAALAVFARWGARWARESAAGPLGTGMLLGMLGFALVWAVQLPLSVVDLWWQRRHGLSHVGYADFLFGNWFALGGQFVFLCFALAIVMGLARRLRRRPRSSASRSSSPSSARTSSARTVWPTRSCARSPPGWRRRRASATFRSSSRRSTTSPRSRTRRRRGSGRAGASSCSTPSSTAASRRAS